MDRLVVNGDKISDYIDIVTRYIEEFIAIVKKIDKQKDSLVWKSENYDRMIILYDNMIKEYLAYTDRMVKLMDFLNRSINRYDDSLMLIKSEYKKLDDEYGSEVRNG